MKTLAIIDSKLACYYLWHRGHSILGAMNLVAKLGLQNLTNMGMVIPIFVMDKGQSDRVKIFPQYKAHRKDLIKKKGEVYIRKQKQLERDYQKMEKLFRIYGITLSVEGLEADDLASIIPSFVKVDNVIFVTSDSDWIKYMEKPSINVKNYYMLHINRQKLISSNDLQKEFNIPNHYFKLLKDIFCGVSKENVSGIKKLGEKTFLKLTQNGQILNIEEISNIIKEKIKEGKLQLPEDVLSLEELVERNFQLFTPIKYKDLEDEKKKEVKRQWGLYSSKSIDDIIETSAEIFGNIYIPTDEEKRFFKLK